VRSGDLATLPAVIVASERMDEDPGWRALAPGELLRVDGELNVTVTLALERPPAHQLSLADLPGRAASSQAEAAKA
jgi:glutamine amidotransferase